MSMSAEQALRRPRAAGFGGAAQRRARRRLGAGRAARHGGGRGSGRRAARLRPAHPRAGGQLPLQHQRRAHASATVTQENVGRPFAIVLDDKVISAPVIREPILGGSGQISGSFTVAAGQRPRHPAARRRAAGARSTIVEERTVGPSLGADFDPRRHASPAIDRRASLVIVFMVRRLRPVRRLRQHRADRQRRPDARHRCRRSARR